jgi:hypothetical protein
MRQVKLTEDFKLYVLNYYIETMRDRI